MNEEKKYTISDLRDLVYSVPVYEGTYSGYSFKNQLLAKLEKLDSKSEMPEVDK